MHFLSRSLRLASLGRRAVSTQISQSIRVDQINASFAPQWLRDNCRCAACIHPTTSQKLHRSPDVLGASAANVKWSPDGLEVRWEDFHVSRFSPEFLASHKARTEKSTGEWEGVSPIAWDEKAISASPSLFVPYDGLKTEDGLRSAMGQLAQYGLVFFRGLPSQETSDERCEVRKLAGVFGQLRETFYGATWDVRNVSNSRNVAYTNIFLGFHMDMLYFKSPPRYQFLHCLKNRVEGGESMFIDALRACEILRAESPKNFDILTSTPVPFHYDNDGHHLRFNHPTIELNYTSYTTPEQNRTLPSPIRHINYSPPFQAPLYHTDEKSLSEFYAAMRHFDEILEREGGKMTYLLKEGDAVLFDNRRVLHARNSFNDKNAKDGETNRWLKGCYIEADDVQDRWRVLNAKLQSQMREA